METPEKSTDNVIKINHKTAEAEFTRFVEAWDIDADLEDMEVEDVKSFEDQKRKIVKAIKKGRASISEDGTIVNYNLIVPVLDNTAIIMKIPKGDSFMAMDRYKEKQQIHKMYAFMAASSGLPVQIFTNMDGRDLKFCMGISLLFLAS